jgi:excisionase family DNA binding protein
MIQPAPDEDSRFVKGNPMAKTSLISWRLREKKFPDTEAQRRARARERSIDGGRRDSPMKGLGMQTGAPPSVLFEFDEDHLMDELSALALLNPNSFPDTSEETVDVPTETCVSLGLTADQSCVLHTLPFLSKVSEDNAFPAVFHLRKSQDHRGTTLQFSLQTQALPEMLSLKEVCRQLQVGRRAIMQLIRRRELRCYRIAHRYRFSVEDVKNYLENTAVY